MRDPVDRGPGDERPDELSDELGDELGSIASFIARVAKTPAFEPGELLELAAGDPDLELTEKLGAGGMGVVYRARDRKLDREVAVKVQRVSGDDEADERLLAEARALARLAHPNVVGVHEVRRIGGNLLVLMELVRGPTLRAWMGERDRERDEILAAFAAAGAGLAAAHRSGVVHRDFKPDNVIVGDDGRVRVVDFGLAGAEGERISGGTPAYMAPEQIAGEAIDARADQYAWCVALREALGDPPGWLRRALDRGLSADPADRWPTMTALLAAARPPRRWPLLAGLAAAAAVAALVLGSRGCSESIGLAIDKTVAERGALVARREAARDHIAAGRLLDAATELGALYGELDDPTLALELGSAMIGVDAFVRETAIDGGGAVGDLALRGAGDRLAVVSDGAVRLLDTADDRVLLETEGESARFVDGERRLLTSTRAGALSIWDAASGAAERTIAVGPLSEIAAGGDVVFVHAAASVRAYSVRDGSLLFAVPTEGEPVGGLSVSADGQRMLVARSFTTLYDRSGEVLLKAARPNLVGRGEIAPDGTRFAMAMPASVLVLASDGGEKLFELRPVPEAIALRHDAAGERLLVIDSREACVWSLERRARLGCWRRPAAAMPAPTPDFERIAAARADGVVELRDGSSGRRRVALPAHPGGEVIARITADGSRVITAGVDGRLRWWRGDVDSLAGEIEPPAGAALELGGDRVALATERTLAIWELDHPARPLREIAGDGGRGRTAALSGDGAVAAWSGKTWDVASGRPIADIPGWSPRQMIALDGDGGRLFGCFEGACRGVDARTGARLWSLEVAALLGMAQIPAVAVSTPPKPGPGGVVLLTGMGSDVVLDAATGAIRNRLERKTATYGMSQAFIGAGRVAIADSHRIYITGLDGGAVDSVAGLGHGLVAHPDGERLVYAIPGGALIADLRSGRRLRVDVPIEPSGGAAISPDGALLALGRGLGLIEIFDVGTGRKITDRSAGDFVNSLSFTSSGRLVALGPRRILVWALPVETRPPAQARRSIDRLRAGSP